jgi:KaiC/GvpD/RAD55 family RecA-like ATPase
MNHAERVLVAHLTEVESLEYLASEGFMSTGLKIIPTELIRKLVTWSLEYLFRNGRKVAPSTEAFEATWADELEQSDVELGDGTETDSIEWAVEQLRTNFAQWRSQEFVKGFAMGVAKADPTNKVQVIQEAAHELYELAQALVTRKNEMSAVEGFEDALRRHEELALSGQLVRGMTFGMPLIDDHFGGVHEGEIALFAAGSGVGKSWFGGKVLWNEFRKGRRAVLFTLENDLPMTFDRLACMAARVEYEKWQRGQANEGDIIRVKANLEMLRESDNAPTILMPEAGHRTVQSMTRKAVVLGGQSIIIDQLSHIEPAPGSRATKRNEEVAGIMRGLKVAVNEGHDRLSCLLLHQVNRDGKKSAARSGRYVMEDLADSSEVEKSSDFIIAGYQSEDARAIEQAVLMMLKGRRVPIKEWLMWWRLGIGDISAIRELTDAA